MYYYQIAAVTLKSPCRVNTFEPFSCDYCDTDITLEMAAELPPPGADCSSGLIVHRRLPDGWFFHSRYTDEIGVYIREDYSLLKIYGGSDEGITPVHEWYIRIAVECLLARRGYVSLHAAAVETDGEAFAFSGPSGVGKSTRATAWIEGLEAKLVSGDRPLIDVQHNDLYGVPWDGKEQCFRNVHYPLKAICEVRRSGSVYPAWQP